MVLRSARIERASAGAACCRKDFRRASFWSLRGVCLKRRASIPTRMPSASSGTARQAWIGAGIPLNQGSCWEKSLRSIVIGRLSRIRSWTTPVSRDTERFRKGRVPSPSAAMQRKMGCTASGAQRIAPSASATCALHLAAQPEVCARFSQSASSARAETSEGLEGPFGS